MSLNKRCLVVVQHCWTMWRVHMSGYVCNIVRYLVVGVVQYLEGETTVWSVALLLSVGAVLWEGLSDLVRARARD